MSYFLVETERLGIRRLGPGDVDALHDDYGDAEAMRWVGDGQPLDRAGCERWVAVTKRSYRTRGYGIYALAPNEKPPAARTTGGFPHPIPSP